MAASPYFESASGVIDQSKASLLKAVAEGGTAGKQAFDAAQAQAAQAKQEAVTRAAQRSTLYGVGGNDQTFMGAYDDRMNQGAVNRTNFESGLAQTQASGESYMEKARASIPVLQSININKGVEQETKIKTAIAAAQAKAQAAAEKEARDEQARLDRETRSTNAAIARENRAEGRALGREGRSEARADARASKTAAAKDPTFDRLIAGGKILTGASPLNKARLDTGNILDAVTRHPDIRMAELAGRDMGYSPLQIGTAMNQQKTQGYEKRAVLPPTPDEKWLTSNVRGMDSTKAKQALAAPEMNWARDFINDTLSAVQLDESGLIASAPPGFDGMIGQKPQAAFDSWVRSQRGNLTMKDALSKYYGPTVASMFTSR